MGRWKAALLFLATVGAVAPFVGLFGTVWGIMNSFQAIAMSRDTNLAVVAPGIAEGLVCHRSGACWPPFLLLSPIINFPFDLSVLPRGLTILPMILQSDGAPKQCAGQRIKAMGMSTTEKNRVASPSTLSAHVGDQRYADGRCDAGVADCFHGGRAAIDGRCARQFAEDGRAGAAWR